MVTMSNFPLQNREKRKILSVKFFVIFFLVIMFGVANTVFPNFFSGVFHSIGEPAWKAQDATATKILSSSKLLQSKKSLVEENIRLATQIEKMSNLVLEKDLLQEENDALKERFGRDTSENILLATVLARPSVSLYDTFVIDVGSNDGVKIGERVLVWGNVVIGTVSKVYKSTSIVTLFSAPGQKSNIMIGPDKIIAEAIGRGGGNFSTQLPRATDIVEGDIVTMPGINPKIFGVVESATADSADPFQIILFKNPINLNQMRWVEIVLEDIDES